MRDKILELIFKAPEKWVHIREMARRMRISPNTVRDSIVSLKKNGIVDEKKEGNMIMFRANIASAAYRHEKRMYNLRAVYDSGVVDCLSDYYSPSAIVLFGSYSRGEDMSTSDIDIGIITGNKKRPNLRPFEKKLSRRIELSLFTRKEVSDEFFNNIINGIVLKGVLKVK